MVQAAQPPIWLSMQVVGSLGASGLKVWVLGSGFRVHQGTSQIGFPKGDKNRLARHFSEVGTCMHNIDDLPRCERH